jgi:hypothetical protein
MISAAVITKLRIGSLALSAGLALGTATIVQIHSGGHGGGAYDGGRGDSCGGRRGGYGCLGLYGFGLLGYGLFFDALIYVNEA